MEEITPMEQKHIFYCPNWTKTKFQFSPVGHYNPCEEKIIKKIMHDRVQIGKGLIQ